jgi:hypothetical protein
LGRQGPCDDIDLVDQAGVDRLAEAGDTFRQLHAIDAVLHIAAVVAHMHGATSASLSAATAQMAQSCSAARLSWRCEAAVETSSRKLSAASRLTVQCQMPHLCAVLHEADRDNADIGPPVHRNAPDQNKKSMVDQTCAPCRPMGMPGR